jgi:hypothetical protein
MEIYFLRVPQIEEHRGRTAHWKPWKREDSGRVPAPVLDSKPDPNRHKRYRTIDKEVRAA